MEDVISWYSENWSKRSLVSCDLEGLFPNDVGWGVKSDLFIFRQDLEILELLKNTCGLNIAVAIYTTLNR